MTIDDLTAVLNELSTARLQRLTDRLEGDPEVPITVGAWRPRCPMVLAGYDPLSGSPGDPEDNFAHAWDRFAAPSGRWHLRPRLGRDARRCDVQALLRAANAVLAKRAAAADAEQLRAASASLTGGRVGARP